MNIFYFETFVLIFVPFLQNLHDKYLIKISICFKIKLINLDYQLGMILL